MQKYLLFFLCIFLLGCTQQQEIIEEHVNVHRVIDGDTFTFLNQGKEIKVRMIGINAPELKSKDCYAEEAKQALAHLIEGKEVVLVKDPMLKTKDPYGRLLRSVQRNETNIDEYLLKEGYVRTYDTWQGTAYGKYVQTEAEAKRLKKGLWKECTNEILSETQESADSRTNG